MDLSQIERWGLIKFNRINIRIRFFVYGLSYYFNDLKQINNKPRVKKFFTQIT